MTKRFWLPVIVLVIGILPVAGCKHWGKRSCSSPCPPFAGRGPGPLSPVAPQGVPVPPPPPVPIPGDVRYYSPVPAPPAAGAWQPAADGNVRLAVPEAAAAAPPREPARLQPPEPPLANPAPPPVAEQRSPTPSLPVGIPQFSSAKDRVASGLKPFLDGLDWLQANGYRTVLNVRPPGEDDAADRQQFEKRGLKYLSLEVSPQTLSRSVVDEFNRVVRDSSGLPLFVYDKDGMLAGGLWYLHFRTVDRATDEEARTKAARLGLKEDPSGDHKTMWLAIQKYLSQPNP